MWLQKKKETKIKEATLIKVKQGKGWWVCFFPPSRRADTTLNILIQRAAATFSECIPNIVRFIRQPERLSAERLYFLRLPFASFWFCAQRWLHFLFSFGWQDVKTVISVVQRLSKTTQPSYNLQMLTVWTDCTDLQYITIGIYQLFVRVLVCYSDAAMFILYRVSYVVKIQLFS